MEKSLSAVLSRARAELPPRRMYDAVKLMISILERIAKNPGDDKYRSVNTACQAFAPVGSHAALRECFVICGFTDKGQFMEYDPATPTESLFAALDTLHGVSLDLHEEYCAAEEKRLAEQHDRMMKNEERRKSLLAAESRLPQLVDTAERVGDVNTLAKLPDKCIETLVAVLRNCLLHPGDAKFHRLRCSNAKVQQTIAAHPDALAFLAKVGFESEGGELVVRNAGQCEQSLAGGLRTLEDVTRVQLETTTAEFNNQVEGMEKLRAVRQEQQKQQEVSLSKAATLGEEQKEYLLAATQLISDIQGFMEQEWLLRGAVGYEAQFRKEGRRLMDEFKETLDIAKLHAIRDDWEKRVLKAKDETGRTMINTIYTPNDRETGKPHPSTFTGKNV
eukprot:Sspe_Gene.58727::Locus_32234_Transcript_1_2_Confidence_0.750_Length_1263::g.58727::m.58727